MATGSLPGGASASVHTSASQAAFSAEKSSAVGAYTGSDFTAGVVAIPAEWTVIIVNSGSSGTWAKGVAPAQIAARVHGTVLLSTTPPAAAPPKTTPPTTTPPKTTPPKTTPPTTQPSKTPAPVQPPLTNGVAVVTQYYQDVSDKNYAAAWAIGGSNLAAQNGQTYASWVAGYADTTASISITSYGTWSNGTVWCYISAVQYSGAVNTYYGTYTVANGVIVSASIRQVGVVAKRTAPGDFTADDLETACAGATLPLVTSVGALGLSAKCLPVCNFPLCCQAILDHDPIGYQVAGSG